MSDHEEQNVGNQVVDRKTEQGFTPGPWEYRNGYVYHWNATDRAGRQKSYAICGVWLPGANEMQAATGDYGTTGQSKAIRDANGLLLAAAPSLHDAAKFARSVLASNPMELSERMAIEKLDAALALVAEPANESAKRPISNHGNNGQV